MSDACRTLQALQPESKIVTADVLSRLTRSRDVFGPEAAPIQGGFAGGYHTLRVPRTASSNAV
ncbi:hypothetical protein [Pseudofrankia asymbiotica]|uniref:hypothetical protein n=1 Tax=Pseudofrankia asymbiotica TaxID=1834516 RepID=UPI001F51E79E|nr:hypothetical protein [Pseudofrankia asymbiotica]